MSLWQQQAILRWDWSIDPLSSLSITRHLLLSPVLFSILEDFRPFFSQSTFSLDLIALKWFSPSDCIYLLTLCRSSHSPYLWSHSFNLPFNILLAYNDRFCSYLLDCSHNVVELSWWPCGFSTQLSTTKQCYQIIGNCSFPLSIQLSPRNANMSALFCLRQQFQEKLQWVSIGSVGWIRSSYEGLFILYSFVLSVIEQGTHFERGDLPSESGSTEDAVCVS